MDVADRQKSTKYESSMTEKQIQTKKVFKYIKAKIFQKLKNN